MQKPEDKFIPESLALIAGRGVYPRLLAESARAQGVRTLYVVAFRGETEASVLQHAQGSRWIRVGQLGALLEALAEFGARHAVMAGQIKPTHLFRVRPDRAMLQLLGGLRERNAHTIYGAVCTELERAGVTLLPASRFMEGSMPPEGVLGRRSPTEREWQDIRLGREVAHAVSALEIGQTVVVKEGTVLAVEAFEGTDAAVRRAGRLGGAGAVVVKVAKRGHDMRFDIPVIGERTLAVLRKAGVSALAVEAGRAILLDRRQLSDLADRAGLALVAVEPDTEKDVGHGT